MKSLTTCLALGLCCLTAQAEPDFLRFENGDQMSGHFLGMNPQGDIRWESAEIKEPTAFRTETLRHLVLRGGKPQRVEETLSHLGLTNGDRIPGRISGIDGTHVTLDTKFSGTLRVPKEHVSLLAANPLGGRVHYFGPFSADGWQMLQAKPATQEEINAEKNTDKSELWEFSGSAWFWKGNQNPADGGNSVALTRADGMPDRSVLRFRMGWKDRVAMSIAFHADFAPAPAPGKQDEEGEGNLRREQGSLPAIFGNCYVLQIFSSHIMLYRSSWDPAVGPRFDRLQMNSNYIRLGEERNILVEIRSNRTNGHISLFLNDEFVSQWSEPAGNDDNPDSFAGKGGGFGFLSQSGGSAVRISEIMVSEWNGMPDSARSMELDDKDVVLMTNGTDRFAGKILGMDENDIIRVESRHGTILVPIHEIAEIRFARSQLAKTEIQDGPAIHLGPIGKLSVKSIAGERELLKLQHSILGPLDLRTDPVIMIEYKPGTRIVDGWDVDF